MRVMRAIMVILMCAAAACADFGASSRFSECDADGKCVGDSTCAVHPTLGKVCFSADDFQLFCGKPETCNGDDDNCDGMTDEDVTNRCGTCGTEPTEICNGFDDNCDGMTDEGIPDYVGDVPDIGECQPRIERCSDGQFTVVQEQVLPTTETCDLLDNDCDGMTNEDLEPNITATA